jgi:peptidoglycan/xylan/chitin deacetylase (PgdA/CDA1 family)
MRLDRFLTLFIFAPFKELSRKACDLEIPILMYHSIANDVDDSVHPYYRTVTTPETFEKQIAFLHHSGYEVLTLSDAVKLLQNDVDTHISKSFDASYSSSSTVLKPINLLRRPVVLTFDDGFQDFYTTAFPILERFGFKATVFLTSGLIGKVFVTGRQCLNREEIQELVARGIEFGSHTVNHPQLKTLPKNEIIDELAHSKKTIEDITRSEVTLFSYPYGFPEEDEVFVMELNSLLIAKGYTAGVTTSIGLSREGDNLLFLKRLPVNDCDDKYLFRSKLAGSYDWLYRWQLMYKRLRPILRNSVKA